MAEKDINDLLSWLNPEEIKYIQQSYYKISGLPVSVVTAEGKPITPKIGGTTFCDILVQQSKEAFSLCGKCRLYAAKESLSLRRGLHYYCHMGMVEFSAPLVVEGQVVAYMTSGMIFDRPPVERDIREFAKRYNIEPDFLWEAAQKIPVKDQDFIERATEGLFNYASIITASANIAIRSYRATQEVERAAQMKNDFLANMSHEIRTPMNAVIGMAELASQEEISDTAREYLDNIQSSGKTLLHIINDILDYSKISSGKMSIFEDRFSVVSLIRDVTSIITTRLLEKHGAIYLYVDVAPDIPSKLVGDVARIQQIIINLANNAVKFTNSGFIRISFSGNEMADKRFKFCVSVQDSGIGIKDEDREKLFSSFSQVDSRRNRNVEGTGLGLAIVRQLVSLMDGEVNLESVYGVGSTFSFYIPLPIYEADPIVSLKESSDYSVLMTIHDNNVFSAVHTALDNMNIPVQSLDLAECSNARVQAWKAEHKGKKLFAFIDQYIYESGYLKKTGFSSEENPGYTLILVPDRFFDERKTELNKGIKLLKYPITTISLCSVMVEGNVTTADDAEEKKKKEFKFTAPEAKVLVVDDIPMNLKLAERLLARLQIKADLAESGQAALDKLDKEQYDIIFMDHMMPELDGIDTTRLIRRFHPDCDNTPIIALTANVMEDAKKMFLNETMSDVIPKPIEVKTLHEKLLQWLPPEKIIPSNS